MDLTQNTPEVYIQLAELDAEGNYQISARGPETALLRDRRPQIEAAVRTVADILRGSLDDEEVSRTTKGWSVSGLEATFGLKLGAEGSILVSKATAEASFEVKLLVTRS